MTRPDGYAILPIQQSERQCPQASWPRARGALRRSCLQQRRPWHPPRLRGARQSPAATSAWQCSCACCQGGARRTPRSSPSRPRRRRPPSRSTTGAGPTTTRWRLGLTQDALHLSLIHAYRTHAVWCCTASCPEATLCCAIPRLAISCPCMPCHAMLCYPMPCTVALFFYAMLFFTVVCQNTIFYLYFLPCHVPSSLKVLHGRTGASPL